MSVSAISKSGSPSFTQTSTIPLTTVFTPPFKSCTDTNAGETTPWAGKQVAIQLDSGIQLTSCYPSSYSEYMYSLGSYYSPGVCPLSYEYVATSVTSQGSAPATTMAICCPPGIHAVGATGWSCGQVEPGTTYFANPYSVAWQKSDLSSFTPASAPVLALKAQGITFPVNSSTQSSQTFALTNSNSIATASATESSATPTATSHHQHAGLSSSAAAGIGVGATIAVGAIIGLLWWASKRYKLTRREDKTSHAQVDPKPASPEKSAAYTVHEAPTSRSRYEADPDHGIRNELDGQRRHELEGSWEAAEAGHGMKSPV